jgi:peptidoglycan/xylan/chitin deacetylase (PgdA/CDA1 family)
MKKRNILIASIFFVLIGSSCNKANQDTDNTQTSVTESATVKEQTPNTPAQILAKPEIPVLCYHRISDNGKGDYTVSPATFRAHMQVLADSGYHTVLPDELYNYLVYNASLPTKPVMISFDDSRTEHAEIAAPVMENLGFRGVFFIMTITYNKKNYMTTEQIAALAKAGHTIGLHSWDHTMATKYMDSIDWQKQVIAPKQKLENIIGKPVDYWAYPNGVYNHKAAEELSKHMKLSFTLYSKRDSLLPLQTVRRIIIPECTPKGLLKSIHRSFPK